MVLLDLAIGHQKPFMKQDHTASFMIKFERTIPQNQTGHERRLHKQTKYFAYFHIISTFHKNIFNGTSECTAIVEQFNY